MLFPSVDSLRHKTHPLLQEVIPVFRNPDPAAFLESWLLEMKIIYDHII